MRPAKGREIAALEDEPVNDVGGRNPGDEATSTEGAGRRECPAVERLTRPFLRAADLSHVALCAPCARERARHLDGLPVPDRPAVAPVADQPCVAAPAGATAGRAPHAPRGLRAPGPGRSEVPEPVLVPLARTYRGRRPEVELHVHRREPRLWLQPLDPAVPVPAAATVTLVARVPWRGPRLTLRIGERGRVELSRDELATLRGALRERAVLALEPGEGTVDRASPLVRLP